MEAEKGRRGGAFLAEHIYDARLTGVIGGDLSREHRDVADCAREAAAPGEWAGIR